MAQPTATSHSSPGTGPAVAADVDPNLTAAGPALTDRAASGFVWTITQTVSIKLIGFVAQILLARLLLREDFGQVALAYTVAGFATLLQQAGLRETLIRRQRKFDRWSNAAFWMSLALGLLAGTAMVLAAPLAGRVYGDPTVAGLILVVAATTPLNSVSIIPSAKLQAQLRFREMAAVGVFESFAVAALSVLFASPAFRAGAWSFVLPLPIVAAARLAILWWLARPRVRWTPQGRRWRYLYAEGGLIFASYVCFALITQGDYVILKLVSRSTRAVGDYYFAFILSMQTVALLTVSLMNVLLPVLSQLSEDPARQVQAFVRATRLLAVISLPPCLLQAALAEPLIRLAFGEKWLPAVPILQVLSAGMAVRIVAGPVHSLFTARGALRTYFAWSVLYAAVFLVCVTAGAKLGGAIGTAVGVAVSIWTCETYALVLALRPGGLGWRAVFRVFCFPMLASVVAVGLAAWVGFKLPPVPLRDLWVIVVTCLLTLGFYVPLARGLAPAEWTEAVSRLRVLFARFRRTPVGSP